MNPFRGSFARRLLSTMVGAFILSAFPPLDLGGVAGETWVSVDVGGEAGDEYLLSPGEIYEINVSSSGPLSEVELVLTGPAIGGLTDSFQLAWNDSGFHDLSAPHGCLLPESCSASAGLWRFALSLPNETASGVWEARAVGGSAEGVSGFMVSTVYWGFEVLSCQPLATAAPGGVANGTVTVGFSCNGDVGIRLGCTDLSGPGGRPISGDRLAYDDDPLYNEEVETGAEPVRFGNGSVAGPVVGAGPFREVELHLFLSVPCPMESGWLEGSIEVDLEAVEGSGQALVDAYISTLRYMSADLEPGDGAIIDYGADLDTASHGSGSAYPLDVKLKQLSVLEEAGVDTVRITQAYDPFLDDDHVTINATDDLVEQIRSGGSKLMLADGGAERYWVEPLNWSEFTQAFVERVTDLASRYRPEYYVVVKEPIWYMAMNWSAPGGMLTESVSVAQWVSLTEQLCASVKNASPTTATGVSIALPYQESLDYLMGVQDIDEVDFVGIDIYRLRDLDVLETIDAGLTKEKWILETWDGHPETQEGQGWRATSAAEWITMISNYARSWGYAGISTFYNLYLCFDYEGPPGDLGEFLDMLDWRQESFYALQALTGDS